MILFADEDERQVQSPTLAFLLPKATPPQIETLLRVIMSSQTSLAIFGTTGNNNHNSNNNSNNRECIVGFLLR
jgi:hypothetical protein